MKQFKIREIDWTDERKPDNDIRYNHVIGACGLGRFTIEWKSWKESDSFDVFFNDDHVDSCFDLSSAKAVARDKLREVILSCLESE